MIDDRNDISDRKDRNEDLSILSSLSNISSITDIQKALGSGVLEKILALLYNIETGLSYEQIAEAIKEERDYVNTTMFRNMKDQQASFFEEVGKDGKQKLFKLSEYGNSFVKEKVEVSQRKNEFQAKSLSQEEDRLKRKQELQSEAKIIVQEIRPEFASKSAFFDFGEIISFNPAFGNRMLEDPDSVFKALEEALSPLGNYKARVRNLPGLLKIKVEDLRAEHINQLAVVEGRIVSLSEVRPVIVSARFECPTCGAILTVIQDEKKFREPSRCSCKYRGKFRVLAKELVDTAYLMIEDLQENTETANLRRTKVRIQEDLTTMKYLQMLAPGNEVRLTGVLREDPVYLKNSISTHLGWIFEVVAVEPFEEQIDLSKITEKEMEEIKKLSEKGIDDIIENFAQGVVGKEYDPIKKSLLLQICSRKNDPKHKAVRNSMNILLIGDPGVAKSIMASSLQGITTGCTRAFGGGSSAVGLTASVIKEEESFGGYRCEPGALVLAKNLLILEELNNLSSDEEKSKLQEGLSEQSVTINKANIKVRMRVTAGVLATANPIHGAFRDDLQGYAKITEQFNIPLPILNRFDVVFVLKDKNDPSRDKSIAKRMLERDQDKLKPKYSQEFLKKFFEFVRSQDDPIITKEIADVLSEMYPSARKNNKEGILVNARFFESLLRLVKASARLRLSKKVELRDIEIANEILKASHYNLPDFPIKMQEVMP